MKYADINKRFTEIVAEYIGRGYLVNSATMSGSQGETAKIDLTNGTDIIRVLIASFDEWESYSVEGFEITVGRVQDASVKPHANSGFHTLWNNRLDILHQERFYKIGEARRHGAFYGTREDALPAALKG